MVCGRRAPPRERAALGPGGLVPAAGSRQHRCGSDPSGKADGLCNPGHRNSTSSRRGPQGREAVSGAHERSRSPWPGTAAPRVLLAWGPPNPEPLGAPARAQSPQARPARAEQRVLCPVLVSGPSLRERTNLRRAQCGDGGLACVGSVAHPWARGWERAPLCRQRLIPVPECRMGLCSGENARWHWRTPGEAGLSTLK